MRSTGARALVLAAVCAIISISFNGAAATITFPAHAKQGDLWKSIQAQDQMLFRVNTPELWFTQQIDHFASSSAVISAKAGNTTYQQRYYEDNTFWKQPNDPVILYIGGEGALASAPAGFVQVLAQRYGAKILALEHRFYGKSIPNGNLETENYKYLTVQQALADLKHFKESYQKNNIPANGNNKWIAIGGSYPGALSAWFRIAYPDTTVASLSSSGVVDPVYEFYQFDEQVALSAGEKCANVLRKTTASFEDQISNGNATKVKGLLGAQDLCDADFFYMIADSAAMAVQYGHKNVLCDHMVDTFEKKQSLTEQFANFTIQMYGKEFGSGCFYDTNCLANDRSRWADVRSWRWQKCYQLAYFQIAPKNDSLRASMVNLNYHEKQCQAVFGDVVNPKKGTEEITKLYGGKHPHGHRIFFSNGGDDPWQRASVLTSISDDEPANLAVCDLCGHCGDLRTPGPDTPAPLQKQREEILAYFDKWLSESEASEETVAAATALAREQESDASVVVDRKTATTPLVLVPIVFAFLALLVILHVDLVRDSPSNSGYERLSGV
ncbi:Serine protease family s28, partial [Globisporangium splendens]